MAIVVSIIISVHNSEKYIAQCLQSVLEQSFDNLQIICINDGSTDHSYEIMHSLAQKDSRIILVDQENTGYGAALNKGLEMASGKYIGILESDDFIDPFMYESMLEIAEKCYDVEIVKCAYWDYFEYSNGTHKLYPSMSSKIDSHLFPFKIEQYPELLIYHPSIWTCLYRKDFLVKNQLRFVEAPGAGWVDNPFFFESLLSAEKIIWTNDKHYYYRRTNPECSSNLKDCTIPLKRLIDIWDVFKRRNINNPVILDYFFKRCLIYIQLVLQNEYYDKTNIEPYINQVIAFINPENLQSDFYTDEERGVYRLFSEEV